MNLADVATTALIVTLGTLIFLAIKSSIKDTDMIDGACVETELRVITRGIVYKVHDCTGVDI